MRKIYFLFVMLAFLQSCKNDSDENLSPDVLKFTVDGQIAEADGRIFDAGDGNWGANFKPEFAGKLDVSIQTDKDWQVIVKYITSGEEEWLIPSAVQGVGNAILNVDLKSNKSIRFRKASITIRTMGNIPVYKTLTVIQSDSEPIIEFEPEGEDATYDSESKTLRVGYNSSSQMIGVWSNIEEYALSVTSAGQDGSVDWIKEFKVDDGTISFTTLNNFTGDVRRAHIIMEADGFEDSYILEQAASLYKNVLLSVNGETSEGVLSHIDYGMKARDIVLVFDSNKELSAELIDKTTLAPVAWATVKFIDNKVTIKLPLNDGSDNRSAILRVKASDTGLAEQKPLEWSFSQSQETLQVNWKGMLDNKLVFGPNARQQAIEVATYVSADEEVAATVSAGASWLNAVVEGGKIKLTMTQNNDGEKREAVLQVQNVNGKMKQSIVVQQYPSDALTPKTNWRIESGNDKTTEYGSDKFSNIIDGNSQTQWQWDWGHGETSDFPNTPYEFIIDFGSEQIFNMISLWQTQKATNGYVKDVQFKVSSDKATWIDAGKYRMSASTDEAKAYGNNPYNYNLPATFKARYVRLIILSNVGDSGVNYFKNAYLGEFSAFLK